MLRYPNFYINGQWVAPVNQQVLDVINPATEEPFAEVGLGSEADVNAAVSAAKSASLIRDFAADRFSEMLAWLRIVDWNRF